MADGTAFDSEEIDKAAKEIGGIMQDMSAFQSLKEHWPNAGKFESAQWLERVVDDRRNGLVAHAERMKNVLEEMETQLSTIARDFENMDGENAGKIKTKVDDMRSNIDSSVAQLDKGTEADQHNFSEDPNVKPADNGSDGDGYNDTLPA